MQSTGTTRAQLKRQIRDLTRHLSTARKEARSLEIELRRTERLHEQTRNKPHREHPQAS